MDNVFVERLWRRQEFSVPHKRAFLSPLDARYIKWDLPGRPGSCLSVSGSLWPAPCLL